MGLADSRPCKRKLQLKKEKTYEIVEKVRYDRYVHFDGGHV